MIRKSTDGDRSCEDVEVQMEYAYRNHVLVHMSVERVNFKLDATMDSFWPLHASDIIIVN